MKTVTIMVAVLATALLVCGSSQAQVSVEITAGYDMPTGDFADNSDPGYGVGGNVFFGLPMIPIEIGGRAAYNYFGASDDFGDGQTTIIEILPSVRYVLGFPMSPVKVFGQLGAGMYMWKNEFEVKGFPIKTKDDGSDFGISVGAGVRAKLGPLAGLTVLPLYHIIMTEEKNTTYLSLNVGIVF